MEEIKKMNRETVSDKKFCKAMTCYVEEDKRDLLAVTVFDGKPQFSASPQIAKIMEDHPHVLLLLKGVFENQLGAKEVVEEKLEVKVLGDTSLPLLFAPFKDKESGWTKENGSEQLTLYFNLLGYGIGGDKSLVKTRL